MNAIDKKNYPSYLNNEIIMTIDGHSKQKFFYLQKYFKEIKNFHDSLDKLLKLPLYRKLEASSEILPLYVPKFIRDTMYLTEEQLLAKISQGLTYQQASQTLDAIEMELRAHARP
jgi:hypothetical protein